MKRISVLIIGLVLAVILFQGLKPKPSEKPETTASPVTDTSSIPEPEAFSVVDLIKKYKAEPMKAKHGQKAWVAGRTHHLTQFPCAQCHTSDVKAMKAQSGSSARNHSDIKLTHGSAVEMDCATCHRDDDVSTFKQLNGKPVNINHTYQLCSTCHSGQHKDWEGGAHGKRLENWYGERVIQNCTGCHNPHNPSFPKQFPKTMPSIPRTSGVK